jgi:hypothetical protein
MGALLPVPWPRVSALQPETFLTLLLPCLQVTALGQPKLLERVSDSLNAVHNLFRRFDEDLNGVVTRDEFEKVSFAVVSNLGVHRSAPKRCDLLRLGRLCRLGFQWHLLAQCSIVDAASGSQVYEELFSDATPERLQEIFTSLESEDSGA